MIVIVIVFVYRCPPSALNNGVNRRMISHTSRRLPRKASMWRKHFKLLPKTH